jgi:hypothetical protein
MLIGIFKKKGTFERISFVITKKALFLPTD